MTGSDADRIVDDYLARLDRALDTLPAHRAEELVDEIDEHIAAARAELPDGGSEAELLTVLDRLGEPEEIVRVALEQDPTPAAPVATPTRRGGWVEGLAIALLPFGGLLIPVIGWLAGVALLWSSDHWTVRDKLIGTFAPPGGYMLVSYLMLIGVDSGESCGTETDASGRVIRDTCDDGDGSLLADVLVIGGVAVLLLMPLATMVYLLRRRRPLPAAVAVAA